MLFGSEKIIRLQSVASTNDYMIEQIRTGMITQEGTVVLTNEQTTGKGMDKNSWESEPGRNLTVSIYFKPDFLRADQQFLLNKSISLGVFDFVKSLVTQLKVTIKWPNDIYIGDRKIAGILINNTVGGNVLLQSVVGIGININQQKFTGNVRNPVSLVHVLRRVIDVEYALRELLFWIENRYEQLMNRKFEMISADYLESLYRFNEEHFYLYKNEKIAARITGVSDYGHLQLVTGKKDTLECDFKEIEFVIPPVIQ
jgi:BirA family biotin operon repressor/biotin-[acetyl-CoA-carboxylase] ligase